MVWVGGQRTSEGNFRWAGISTSHIDLGPWGDKEPNNYGVDQDCVALDVGDGHRLEDALCSDKSYFACEL